MNKILYDNHIEQGKIFEFKTFEKFNYFHEKKSYSEFFSSTNRLFLK
jgi:hypothetical protein